MTDTHTPFFQKHIVAGVEHRQDPLTNIWTRINPERARRVKHTGGKNPGDDLERLIETSRTNCPFCPDKWEDATPVFPAELVPAGRLRKGENILFPNKDPYGEHHAVGILSNAHHIPLEAYEEKTLLDSLDLSQEYFRTVHQKNSSFRFPVYVWNHLPPSAGSIVHPHIQLLLESRPAPFIEFLIAQCRAWQERTGEDHWEALIQEEARIGERVILIGQELAVMAVFAPRGFREILLVVRGSGSLADLETDQKQAFCNALVNLLKAYHAMGVGSFNLVTFSPPMGETDPPPFPFHARLISRPYPSGIYTNDTGFFERMYDLWIIDTLPEEVAMQVRPFLA